MSDPTEGIVPEEARQAAESPLSRLDLIAREREVLSRIALGVPLPDVLDELLRAVEARGGPGMLTSVLFVSEDGGHLTHGAAPRLPAAYNAAIDGVAIGEGVGSCGTAASRGTPVYVGDIATDPLWVDFRDLAAAHGLRACWSTPIKAVDGATLGTFATYYDAPRSPTPEDLEAIAVVTQTAALAIERHRSDLELKQSRDRLRRINADLELANERLRARVATVQHQQDRLWNNSLDLLAVVGTDAKFHAVNGAWTQLLGWDEDALVGSEFTPLVHPDDLKLTMAAFADIADGPLLAPFEYRLRQQDGDYRWFAWTAVFEDGKIYANGRDVTAQHEQADRLKQIEEALRQAQKMEAVGQLTGGLAHDFNNLLTGMMGNLELLQSRVSRGRLDDLDRFINAAQGAGRRAAALTQRLLAFSRRQTLDPRPTDVNRLIMGLEELLRRTVGALTDIEVVQAGGLWIADIDAAQLENAILNLCINGRDAMPGGGRLTIETANKWIDDRTGSERDLAPGQYLSICVTDTGAGMAPDVIARAFDPFYTTKPLGEGTGLGLSMVYGFARQSGGQVRIYSEVGRGTTVCIYLPRFLGDAVDAEAQERLRVNAERSGGETILVVDDEATIRHLIDEVLDEVGYAVIGAADGAAGLKVLQSGARIDLLITDVGLPNGMNGRQVADAARALRPGLKVLFITGYAENAAVGNGHLEPGMELLSKPFSMNDLTRKVRDILAVR